MASSIGGGGGGAGDGGAAGVGGRGAGGGGGGGDDDERLEADDSMVLNQATRALLMAKLQRDQSAAALAHVNLPTSALLAQASVVAVPSRCVVLQNCFDAQKEDAAGPENAGWETEIESDVRSECENHGKVKH